MPKHTGKDYRYSRDIPAFPTQWLYGLLRALPGERRFLSPLPCQHGPAWIDATVAAPGPHDFAVRCGRFVRRAFTHLTPQRPSQPAPTFRDDREASPFEGTGWVQDSSDLPNCQESFSDFPVAASRRPKPQCGEAVGNPFPPRRLESGTGWEAAMDVDVRNGMPPVELSR